MNDTLHHQAHRNVPLKVKTLSVNALTLCAAIVALLLVPRVAAAQGAVPYLPQPLDGCYDVAVYGVGLYDGGQGQAEIEPPPGEIVLALIEWVGSEDATPGGATLDGASTITVNGNAVIGKPAEALAPDGLGGLLGNAAYDPGGHVNVGPQGWFAWNADIGPGGADIIPAQFSQPLTLQIADWDAVTVNGNRARQTNGASITVVYRTDSNGQAGVCDAENTIQILTGIDTYHQSQNEDISELLVFDIEPAPIARTVRMYFSHAGTDRSQQACRGGAIWMLADDTMTTRPGSGFFVRDYDIVAVDDTNQDGTARGYGINGGVEIVNDPFTSPAMPCTPALNPLPDENYAAGHPYPGGASLAPYRAQAMFPADGGDLGGPGEWGVVEMHIILPPNTAWMAFQLESESDQNGESGGWVGNGVFAVIPTATLGDRVWEDVNGNGLQDAGEPGIVDATINLYDLADNLITSTQTIAGGNYQFDELPTGGYELEFVAPAGFSHSPQNVNSPASAGEDSDADPDSGRTGPINLAPSQVDLDWDAGMYRAGEIGDYVWVDSNSNGLQDDDESGMNVVSVHLRGAGPDDVFATADDIILTTVTATAAQGDGYYHFGDLLPSRYRVTFDLPFSYAFTAAGVGDEAKNSDANPTTGRSAIFTLASGDINLDVDAGLIHLTPGISIQKLPDVQKIARGATAEFQIIVRNDGDNLLTNVQVADALAPGCDAELGDMAVGAEESYTCSLTNVDADFINVATVTGLDEFGAEVGAQDDAAVDVLPTVELTKTANPMTRPEPGGDFDFTLAIHNTSSEPVVITGLDDTNALSQSCLNLVGQTLPVDGAVSCTYVVNHTVINLYENVANVTVEDDEGDAAQATDRVTVEVFDVPPSIDVEKSANRDIIAYEGEDVTFTVTVTNESVEPVTLFFLEDDVHGPLDGLGTCVLPQTIAVGGSYTCAFTVFVIPGAEGETDTITATVNDDEGNEASDADSATVLSLPQKTNSAIGDYVWVDTNTDGIQDDNETGLAGIKVELFRASGESVASVVTNDAGFYQFTELTAGDYFIEFMAPIGDGEFLGYSPTHRGNDPEKDSDAFTVTQDGVEKGRTDIFTLLVDETDMSRDAGLVAPLAIDLVSFTASVDGEVIVVAWETDAEIDTLGYHLYRATVDDRAQAVRITSQRIPSLGADGGEYTYTDESVVAGVTYHYWLHETTGYDYSEYGPVTARIGAANNGLSVFLPMIMGD